ncbi:MAG TPA: hypothetical protein DEG32_15555, partial [Balneolaceae bacterium]|nr:hypothetical protein [Balneolaceae bacterium]
MYIFNYWRNPSFYDVYDYDWKNRDHGGTDPENYLLPLGWTKDEKSLGYMDSTRSPDWSRVSLSPRRYNNKIKSGQYGTATTEELGQLEWDSPDNKDNYWWTHDYYQEINSENFEKGTATINFYNSGLPLVYPIAENYLISTYHYLLYDDKIFNPDMKEWFFMDANENMVRVTRKELEDMTHPTGGQFTNLDEITQSDLIFIEIDKIEQIEPNEEGTGYTLTGIEYST